MNTAQDILYTTLKILHPAFYINLKATKISKQLVMCCVPHT